MQIIGEKFKELYKEDVLTESIETASHTFNLIVWNDEVNTFEWVIKALIEICHQTEEQAVQCTLMIHYKGKYAVKNGDYDTLKNMCDNITDRGINATVEEILNK